MKARTVLALALGVAAIGFGPASAQLPGCADAAHPGGEWRLYGGSLSNARNQPAEDQIGPGDVLGLGVKWAQNLSGAGSIQNTPVVADGCVYITTAAGVVAALNADDGDMVWNRTIPGTAAGTLVGGIITGSPAVVDGTVYVAVSRLHDPVVVALHQDTGEIKWEVSVLDDAKRPVPPEGQCSGDTCSYRNTIIAAPVVWNGLLFQGIMADEASEVPRGGYAILDVADGIPDDERLLVQDWVIDDDEYERGYRGASIWCTAAIDGATGHAYACGGNPASKQIEARHANALIKIDMDRSRSTFGQIVGSYKGDVDQYFPGLDRQPLCDQVPTTLVWSPTCVQLDLDFGASPNLFTDDIGRTMVGALQKSGVYHAVYADLMSRAWTTVVGAPGVPFNASSTAIDDLAASPEPEGGKIFVAATPPGQMWGITKDRGRYRWVAPMGTGPTHFQSVSTANGVVYTVDNLGSLHAFDAELGVPLMRRNLALDVGGFAGDLSSPGVAIARNTIYVPSSSFIVAYSL